MIVLIYTTVHYISTRDCDGKILTYAFCPFLIIKYKRGQEYRKRFWIKLNRSNVNVFCKAQQNSVNINITAVLLVTIKFVGMVIRVASYNLKDIQW